MNKKRRDILSKKNERIKSAPDDLLSKLKNPQRKTSDYLTSKLSKLEVDGDYIVASEKNSLLIQEAIDGAKDYLLKKTTYKDAIKGFSSEFDAQKKDNAKYYESFGESLDTEFADSVVKKIQKETVRNLLSDSIDEDFLKPLSKTLDTAVTNGAGFMETLEAIRDYVEGNEDVDGAILKHAKQIAHDSFANADRGYGSVISDELELEWFMFSGGTVENTRCFCQERHNKFYHYKEIEAWGRGENVGECGFPWKGMNRATNEKTIYQYAGGYNCLHTIAGVSIFDVPKEDVQRNVSNGNYVPSEFEKEQIGIE